MYVLTSSTRPQQALSRGESAKSTTLTHSATVIAYFDNECSSVNFIEYTSTGRCGTFGPGKFIHSAKAVGTCA